MDKSKQILNIVRDRLGNKPTYNPIEFLEMCAVVRDELDTAKHGVQRICSHCSGKEFGTNDGQYMCLSCGTPANR